MNGKRALIAAAVAGLALVGISLNPSHQPHRSDHAAGPRTTTSATPSPSVTISPSSAAPAVPRLLPFGQDQIADAIDMATRFTATYASHRYNESPQTYLDRLRPLMSAQLQPIIERAAADPVTLDRRSRNREIALAHARPEAIRTLGPTSITVLLTATTQITTQHAARQETTRYAVTVIRRDDAWRVYVIELAATGDIGQASPDGNPP